MILKFDFFHENVPFSKFIHFIHQAIKLEGFVNQICWNSVTGKGDKLVTLTLQVLIPFSKFTMKVIFHIIL